MKTPSFVCFKHSILRSVLFPVFTTRQSIFLAAFVLVASFVWNISAYPLALPLALVIVFAAIGSLSASAPAYLVTSSEKMDAIVMALRNGGWYYREKETSWVRKEGKLSTWENDKISIVSDTKMVLLQGPLFTLKKLKRTIG